MFDGKRICARISLGRAEYLATIDTGATRSLISERLVRTYNIEDNGIYTSTKTSVTTVDGTKHQIPYGFKTKFQFDCKDVEMTFLILDDMLDDLILGIDFLQKVNATFSCQNSSLSFSPTAQQVSSLPLLQSSRVPQTPNMNFRRGMSCRGRVDDQRHVLDHNNQIHHMQYQPQHTITTPSSSVSDSLRTAGDQQLEAQQATLPITTGIKVNTAPYTPRIHYVPAYPTHQFATYPAATYFSPQMINNTPPIVNYSSSFPPAVGPVDFQYVPAGEEVLSDGRQTANGGFMPQLWHAQSANDYNQASSLGPAEVMGPNYDTQIPDLTQQSECMQLYEDSQSPDDNSTMLPSHCLHTDPTVTISASTLFPLQVNVIGECDVSLAEQSKNIKWKKLILPGQSNQENIPVKPHQIIISFQIIPKLFYQSLLSERISDKLIQRHSQKFLKIIIGNLLYLLIHWRHILLCRKLPII